MDQNKYRNADNFDGFLAGGLQKHTEPVRPGFTDRILKQVDVIEQQNLLAKIVMQERIALAGCGQSIWLAPRCVQEWNAPT